ncbi:S66 peptidase family protein [Persicitalea jodogahamensis]|uniref:Peptidase S66 n=1 Tax=Persicitalea jodogahamensis TaxID=402147 RepID=A0A8J3D5P1_9BACT|nr:LD-carboxypeptidase [Persicitalea jodogahamensis]GHB77929.1 peptidase S66 [Persicitalea jodogahamensis]
MNNNLILPPYLRPDDMVGVVAPASRVRYEDCEAGLQVLRNQWDLEIFEGTTLHEEYFQYSAPDNQRLEDFQALLNNPNVRAILAARGGYGCSRIVDKLDFTMFKKSPKWLVGFSDLTVFLSHINQLGFAALHAPMVKTMTKQGGEVSMESLRKALFGEPLSYEIPGHLFNRSGTGHGRITGGNLCLLAHLIGSDSAVNTAGKILFIEDINEYLYNIDRMMIQLKRAGQLQNLAGLIVGQFTDSRDNPEPAFGKTAYEIVLDHTSTYEYPVCFDFPVGHVADNRALPVGVMATLDVGENGALLSYAT